MGIVVNLALPFFALILLGAIAAWRFDHREAGLVWLNTFVFYFALPALVFLTVANADTGKLASLGFVAGTTLSTYLVFLTVCAIAVLIFRRSMAEAAIQASAGSYANVGYMGLPLVVAALGEDVAVAATLIFVFDNLVQFSLVPMISALDADSEDDWVAAIIRALRELGLNPLIIAAVLGAFASLFSLELVQPLQTVLEFLAKAALPCALFAIGVTMMVRPFRRYGPEFPVVIAAKMILHPLVVFLVLNLMGGIDQLWLGTAVLMAAMPTAANVYLLARKYDTYVDGASNAILITTLISLFTVTFLLYLIDRQYLRADLF